MVVARAVREGSCNAVNASVDRGGAWNSRVLAACTGNAVRWIIAALRRQVLARYTVNASVDRSGSWHCRVFALAACCTCVERVRTHCGREGPRDTICTLVNTSGPAQVCSIVELASIARDAVLRFFVAQLRRVLAQCALLTCVNRCSTLEYGVLAASTGHAVRWAVAALRRQILARVAVLTHIRALARVREVLAFRAQLTVLLTIIALACCVCACRTVDACVDRGSRGGFRVLAASTGNAIIRCVIALRTQVLARSTVLTRVGA